MLRSILFQLCCAAGIGPSLGATTQDQSLDCVPAPQPIEVDGALDDWTGVARTAVSTSPEPPRGEIAGQFGFCYTEQALYVCGEIVDDQLPPVPAPLGEALDDVDGTVVLYLDLDPRSEEEDEAYDEDHVHLLLRPLQPGRPWDVLLWRGEKDPGSLQLSGLKVASQRRADGSWAFEASVPWATLGLYPDRHRELGLQLELRDRDRPAPGAGEIDPLAQEGYRLTLGAVGGGVVDPRMLPVLRLTGRPVDFSAPRESRVPRRLLLGALAVLAVLGLLSLVGTSSQRIHHLLRPRMRHWRVVALLSFGLIGILLWVGPDAWSRWRVWTLRSDLEGRAARLESVLENFQRDPALADRLQGVDHLVIRDLLEGNGYRPRGVYRFEQFPVSRRGPYDYRSRVEGAPVPYLEHGILVEDAPSAAAGTDSLIQPLELRLPSAVPVHRLHVALASFLPEGVPVIPDGLGIELQFATYTDASTDLFPLIDTRSRAAVDIEDPRLLGVAQIRTGFDGPWSDARLAHSVQGRPIVHVHHLVYEVPDIFHSSEEAALVALRLRKTAAAKNATVWISAITAETGLAFVEYTPLVFGSTDPDGFPVPLRAGQPALREARVLEGREIRIPVTVEPGVQKLRLYYRPDRVSLFSAEAPLEGRARALVEVRLAGRADPVVFPLRTSIEVAEEVPANGRLPETYRSFVVSSFESPEGRQHTTGFELPLEAELGPPPFAVEEVTVKVPAGAGGAFRVAGLTAAVEIQPEPPPDGSPIGVDGAGRMVLNSEIVELLSDPGLDSGFAIVEGGRVKSLSSSTDAELSELLRGTSALPLAEGDEPEEAGAVRRVRRSGRDFLETSIGLPFLDGPWSLRLWTELKGRERIERGRDLTAIGLGVLTLPFGLLLLVDWLTRMTRIRSRLSLLFLLISAAPLAVMFLILVNVVVEDQRTEVRERSRTLLTTARRNIEALRETAASAAAAVHRELSGPLLADPVGNADEIRRLLAVKAEELGPANSVQIRASVRSLGEGGDEVLDFFYSSPQGRLDRRWLAVGDGLSLSGGEVVYSGTKAGADLTVQVAGVVEDPYWELPSVGAGESVSLLAPRVLAAGPSEKGSPVPIEGGTLLARCGDASGTIDREEAESVVRQLDLGQGRVEIQDGEGGVRSYDLVRSTRGEPIAVLLAHVRSDTLTVDLAGFRVEMLWLVLVLAALTLACALFLGSVVTEGITRPLDRLQQGARVLASGGDAGRVEARGGDEVSELASSFNTMSIELQRRIRGQEMMSAATGVLTRTMELSERVGMALDFLLGRVPARSMACYLFASGRDELVLEGFRFAPSENATPPPPRVSRPRGPLGEALQAGQPTVLPRPAEAASWEGALEDERSLLAGGGQPILFLPLGRSGRSGRTTGVVVAVCRTSDPLADLEEAFVQNLMAQFSVAIENARLYRQAIEDQESGAFVHTYFASRAGAAIEDASDSGQPLVLMGVVGRWPSDTAVSAHERRQATIRLARDLQRLCRDGEMVARREGMEFEILLPTDGPARAEELESELLEEWQASELGLTVARVEYPRDGRSREFLFDALRERLAQEGGRDDSEELWERMARRAPEYVFRSEKMIPVLRQVERIAGSDATALVVGETGTGKEVMAQLIHRLSARRDGPFVAVHCAALPESLLEAELFGYEKGAFTGADRLKAGRFEAAHGGTLFLDEVAEIPLSVQVKLLRVLQERRLQRLGGSEEIEVDVRVLAATHRSLESMVRAGTFREDLYYRLQVVTVTVPPLRERWEEVPALVERFIEEHRARPGARPVVGAEPAALDALRRHDWPGNIRELRNVVQRALVLGQGEKIRAEDIEWGPGGMRSASDGGEPVARPKRRERSEPTARTDRPADPADEAAAGDLSPRQHQFLELLAGGRSLSSRDLVDATGVSRRTALRDLQELMKRGLVRREGSRKAAVYRRA